jgi:hypothetical protein
MSKQKFHGSSPARLAWILKHLAEPQVAEADRRAFRDSKPSLGDLFLLTNKSGVITHDLNSKGWAPVSRIVGRPDAIRQKKVHGLSAAYLGATSESIFKEI